MAAHSALSGSVLGVAPTFPVRSRPVWVGDPDDPASTLDVADPWSRWGLNCGDDLRLSLPRLILIGNSFSAGKLAELPCVVPGACRQVRSANGSVAVLNRPQTLRFALALTAVWAVTPVGGVRAQGAGAWSGNSLKTELYFGSEGDAGQTVKRASLGRVRV